MSLDFFLLKFTCILCKKHGTKWKKNDCLHSIFFSQWLTLLCNKNEGSFVQTVDCFNKMCNYFLSSCLLFSEHIPESGSLSFLLLARCVEFLLTYTREFFSYRRVSDQHQTPERCLLCVFWQQTPFWRNITKSHFAVC